MPWHEAEDSLGDHVIYFTETNWNTCLTGRQACAIESAVLHNPTAVIKLLVTAEPNASCELYRAISQLGHVSIQLLNLNSTFARTPLEGWYIQGKWKTSPFRITHLSDAVRHICLWKNGGVYLDLDFIILGSLSDFRNTLFREGLEPGVEPGSSALVFDRGHPFLLQLLKDFTDRYDPGLFLTVGPPLLKFTLTRFCGKIQTTANADTTVCGGVNILPPHWVFPVPCSDWRDLFKPRLAPSVLNKTKHSVGVHFWNKLSSQKRVRIGNGCAYDVLARHKCPKVYDIMKRRGYM